MTSSSFLLVESRFPRRPPALCFRAPFRFPFFCWCSSALIESSSSSKYSFETTRQMTKTKRRSGGQFCWVFCKRFETKQNKKEESTIIRIDSHVLGSSFPFFFSHFFPFSSVKKDAHSQLWGERFIAERSEKKKERQFATHIVYARHGRDATPTRANTA